MGAITLSENHWDEVSPCVEDTWHRAGHILCSGWSQQPLLGALASRAALGWTETYSPSQGSRCSSSGLQFPEVGRVLVIAHLGKPCPGRSTHTQRLVVCASFYLCPLKSSFSKCCQSTRIMAWGSVPWQQALQMCL